MSFVNNMQGIVNAFAKFVGETQIETKKVIWPDRKYVVVATLLTIAIVMALAVFLMGVDFVYSKAFQILDKTF